MSISIPRKLIISIAARQDARGAYGNYLMERQETGTINSQQLNLSRYMAQLVISYTRKSSQKAIQCRYFQRQYRKIMNQCRSLQLQIDAQRAEDSDISNEIHQIENKITTLQTQSAQMQTNWDNINNNTQPVSSTVAMTISDITDSIDTVTNEIKTQTAEKNRLQAQLSKARKEADSQTKLGYDRLTQLVLQYRHRLDRLYGTIMAYGNLCDEYLNYYWHSLCKHLKRQPNRFVYQRPYTFSGICALRDTGLIEKDELFQTERKELNKRLSGFSGFETQL